MVECNLAKVDVAGSSPVSRSNRSNIRTAKNRGPFLLTLVTLLLAFSAFAEDATLATPTGAIRGTLVVPHSTAPVPVVLLIAG